jgi:hypothetical protein
MQTRLDVFNQVGGNVGVTYGDDDWLNDEYLSPKCQTAYEMAIVYLQGACSTNIEKVVEIPSVPVGVDENNLTPFASPAKKYPLEYLIKPRYVDFKTAGAPTNQYKPVQECTILPDTPGQVQQGLFDIRVRGDFRPQALTSNDSVVEIHPLGAHALACSITALIGAERPNQAWVQTYGTMAQNAWDQIAADLQRQQQHLTFRLGSPNRANNNRRLGWNFNLQGNMGWEWRSFNLFVKLI